MQQVVFFYTCLCLLFLFSHNSTASGMTDEVLHIRLPKAGSFEPESTSRFYEQALRLALEKTSNASERIQFDHHPSHVQRERARLLVQQGKLDIIWSSSNKKREEELTPIRFNLIRGINEYRMLLIRADDQPRFEQVKNLADLQKFKIGSGTHWSDTDIYRFNGLPLVTAYPYAPMFRMLKAKRFDYMARSIQEVNYDLERYGKLGLAIEKSLIIHYPQPIYFFVSNDKGVLAARIQRGLEIARDDGSLDELFFAIPNFRQAWEDLQKLNRRVIELKTPD